MSFLRSRKRSAEKKAAKKQQVFDPNVPPAPDFEIKLQRPAQKRLKAYDETLEKLAIQLEVVKAEKKSFIESAVINSGKMSNEDKVPGYKVDEDSSIILCWKPETIENHKKKVQEFMGQKMRASQPNDQLEVAKESKKVEEKPQEKKALKGGIEKIADAIVEKSERKEFELKKGREKNPKKKAPSA